MRFYQEIFFGQIVVCGSACNFFLQTKEYRCERDFNSFLKKKRENNKLKTSAHMCARVWLWIGVWVYFIWFERHETEELNRCHYVGSFECIATCRAIVPPLHWVNHCSVKSGVCCYYDTNHSNFFKILSSIFLFHSY